MKSLMKTRKQKETGEKEVHRSTSGSISQAN